MLMLASAGMLIVTSKTSEIPIIQTMMAAGLGAASAASLPVPLLTINLPSLVMMASALPTKVLIGAASGLQLPACSRRELFHNCRSDPSPSLLGRSQVEIL